MSICDSRASRGSGASASLGRIVWTTRSCAWPGSAPGNTLQGCTGCWHSDSMVSHLSGRHSFCACRTKMQRISQILQFPVVVERSRTFSFDPQLLQEFDFIGGGAAAQRRVLKKFPEPGFYVGPVGLSLDILESLGVHRR